MQVVLNRKSLHSRYMKWVWGPASQFKNLCPYFWLLLGTTVFAPVIVPVWLIGMSLNNAGSRIYTWRRKRRWKKIEADAAKMTFEEAAWLPFAGGLYGHHSDLLFTWMLAHSIKVGIRYEEVKSLLYEESLRLQTIERDKKRQWRKDHERYIAFLGKLSRYAEVGFKGVLVMAVITLFGTASWMLYTMIMEGDLIVLLGIIAAVISFIAVIFFLVCLEHRREMKNRNKEPEDFEVPGMLEGMLNGFMDEYCPGIEWSGAPEGEEI